MFSGFLDRLKGNNSDRIIVFLCEVLNLWNISFYSSVRNRPFPSSLVPLFQRESKCETILMKMTLICMKMKLHVELILI